MTIKYDDRAGLRGYVEYDKYTHIYIYRYIHIYREIERYIHTYIYLSIEREREGQREERTRLSSAN